MNKIIVIYIPVWIDLKHPEYNFSRKENIDLHSSMDRFEASDFELSSAVSVIYIPVWIDLKLAFFEN